MHIPLNERALHFLDAVAEQGGVRVAADHLGMDPATISRTLAQLVEEAGTVLLERAGRGVRLTEAGQLLLQHYRWLRAQREDTLTRLNELKGLQWGSIDLALGEGFIEDLYDTALSSFCREYPGIVIHQHVASGNDILHLVAEGEVHAGLIYDPPPDPRIQYRAVWPQPLRLMVPSGHPLLLRGGPVTMAEVEIYPLALLDDAFGIRQLVDLAAETAQVRLSPRMTSNSLGALMEFVVAGLGVTFLPTFAARRTIAAGHMHPVEVLDSLFARAQAQLIDPPRPAITHKCQQTCGMHGEYHACVWQ